MELTNRLKTIADLVPQGTKLADIGTDHAYLPTWLYLNNRISFAVASDLREGPLSRGMAVAKEQNIPETAISFRCGDGLSPVKKGEVNTIIMAGMGGETISHCMETTDWAKDEDLLFILQPMSSIPELRLWLQENGYFIAEERIAKEGDKLYVIMAVVVGEMPPLTSAELWVGKQYQGMHGMHRLPYLEDCISRRNHALIGMKQGDKVLQAEKIKSLEKTIEELGDMRKEWLKWQL